MRAGHGNVAIFVPHIGCPQRCSFCDQNAISGESAPPTAGDVKSALELAALKGGSKELELAFFGGSFTGIEKNYMLSLLEAAQPFLGNLIKGIRISTRPDYIDEEI
ncbi:MAG: radical SAM protein, partial [Oscillospiraceae bacterium]